MKIQYVGPFAEAAYEMLKQILEVPVERGKLALNHSPILSNGVVVILGLAGDIQGRVMYDMDKSTAIKIAGVMNGMDFDGFDDLAKSTISELGNIITGKAVSILNDRGFKFSITPPTLFVGNQMEMTDLGLDILVIPLEMEYGKMVINVALKSDKILN
jgi:chemotaxis protein CheX